MWIMLYGIPSRMIRHDFILVFLILMSVVSAIRVDWNTNKGPIIPPSTTERPMPKQPYRDPAPVWENQEEDKVNPSPYRYVLPPPSRPKLQDDNYARAPLSSKEESQQKQPNYGKLITKYSENDYKTIKNVPTLAVQYIPNIGFKYNAVVPSAPKVHSSKDTDFYYDKYSKLNGKYNPKSKKFKVYDKVKYVPQVFIFTQFHQQALPYIPTPQPITSQPFTTAQTTSQKYYQGHTSKHPWSQKSSYYQPNTFAASNKSQR